MKKLFVQFALACIVLQAAQTPANGQAPDSDKAAPVVRDHEVLFALFNDWRKAYNSGDASKVASLYAEDGYYRSAHMLARGRQAIESYCRRGIEAGGHVNFTGPFMMSASGDFGYAAADYQFTQAGVTANGRVVLIFKKADGNWLIAAHETLVSDQL